VRDGNDPDGEYEIASTVGLAVELPFIWSFHLVGHLAVDVMDVSQ
jgi:hypothetical protein